MRESYISQGRKKILGDIDFKEINDLHKEIVSRLNISDTDEKTEKLEIKANENDLRIKVENVLKDLQTKKGEYEYEDEDEDEDEVIIPAQLPFGFQPENIINILKSKLSEKEENKLITKFKDHIKSSGGELSKLLRKRKNNINKTQEILRLIRLDILIDALSAKAENSKTVDLSEKINKIKDDFIKNNVDIERVQEIPDFNDQINFDTKDLEAI